MLILSIMSKKKKYITKNLIIVILSLCFLFTGFLLLWVSSLRVPDFKDFKDRKVTESTKIYDKTGEILLYDIHKDIRRTVANYEDIPRYLKNATVAIEDAEFYQHKGIKPTAIIRAILVNLGSLKFSQGGSTITQQVIKNSLLTRDKKISRKLKEWSLSIKLERKMSKEKILSIYLNSAPYGGNIYGVVEASRSFFSKEVNDLTLAQSAYLAALPQAPTFYSPYGNNKNKLEDRKNLVLKRMLELNFITQEEYKSAKKEKVEFIKQEKIGIKAPHFVFYVQSYLEKKYGKDIVENGGLKVVTTIDYELQKKAEEILKKFTLENVEKFNATNSGLIAIDTKTGQILAMVGSRDYFDKEIDGNFNITIAHRQPGSAFKPFVYATAFEKGYTPDTVVFDLKTQFQTTCDPQGNPIGKTNPDDCYTPVNYDGKYHGPMSLRDALAQSVNIPAIKVLYLAGLSDSLQTAKNFGIKSLTNVNQYGLTLVLGGGEVSLLDITNAYGVFANDGYKNNSTPIIEVKDKNNNILEKYTKKQSKVISEESSRKITSILSDNDARAPAFGRRSYLYFTRRDVAVKTGTTNDYKDALIIGYTPSVAVGTWAGNNDNSPMKKKVAGFIAAPMWNAFMKEVLKKYPDEKFKKPKKTPGDIKPVLRGVWKGGESYFIDKISGKIATEYTPNETKEEKFITNVHNILNWVDKKNPLGDYPENPEKDSQFNLWEYPVRKWVEEKGIKEDDINNTIKEYDDIHKPEFIPQIKIINPKNNKSYSINNKIIIQTKNTSKFPLLKINFYINNEFIGTSKSPNLNFSFIPKNIDNINKNNQLKIVGYDSVFNKNKDIINFNIK
jgi:1A family penicillin-binding protein